MFQVTESVAGLGELGEAVLDLGEVVVDQAGDMLAGWVAGVADGQDAADLGEGKAGGLGVTDERYPGDDLVGVVR